jgi:hypothetical protein
LGAYFGGAIGGDGKLGFAIGGGGRENPGLPPI